MFKQYFRGVIMKRELWAIANSFAYGIRVLNSVFCADPNPENEQELSNDELALIAEQINCMCSTTMIEDAQLIMQMVESIPTNRLCEKTDCLYHHPENCVKHCYKIYQNTCDVCFFNKCKYNTNKKNVDNYKKE